MTGDASWKTLCGHIEQPTRLRWECLPIELSLTKLVIYQSRSSIKLTGRSRKVRDEANGRTFKVNRHQVKPYHEGPNLSLNMDEVEVIELIEPIILEDTPEEIPDSLHVQVKGKPDEVKVN
ncbi:hypothetical protein CR513_44424, partial [Mucuna pruriens]